MGNSRKILIIDDDDELRNSLSEQLSLHEEFDTMLAANASDGLKLARTVMSISCCSMSASRISMAARRASSFAAAGSRVLSSC